MLLSDIKETITEVIVEGITQEILKEWVRYEPLTGELWLIKTDSLQLKNRLPYLLGGSPAKGQYKKAFLLGRKWSLHLLIMLYMTGEMPKEGMKVDHKNRDTCDNRWENLRLLTHTENARNQSPTKPHTASGHTGVSIKRSGARRYFAHIRVDKKLVNLGHFLTLVEAVQARRAAEAVYFGTTHVKQTEEVQA